MANELRDPGIALSASKAVPLSPDLSESIVKLHQYCNVTDVLEEL